MVICTWVPHPCPLVPNASINDSQCMFGLLPGASCQAGHLLCEDASTVGYVILSQVHFQSLTTFVGTRGSIVLLHNSMRLSLSSPPLSHAVHNSGVQQVILWLIGGNEYIRILALLLLGVVRFFSLLTAAR